MNIRVEIGRIAKSLAVEELTIRSMDRDDGYSQFTVEEDFAPPVIRTELRVQGRLQNVGVKMLSGVRFDVSYYDFQDNFLGLDRSGLFEDDEIDPQEFLAFDMSICMPDDTHRCVFNAQAKRAGWSGRWL